VTVAAMILTPVRRWWIVLLAAGVAEIGLDLWLGDYTALMIAGFVAANLAEPLLGAALVTTQCGRPDLARRRDLVVFLTGAVVVGPALGAGIGALTVSYGADRELGSTLLEWWLGDGLGVLIVGSLIVSQVATPDRRPLRSAEGLGLVGGTALVAFAAYWASDLPVGFLLLIVVVVAGARFGTRTVTVLALLVTTIAIASLSGDGQLIAGVDNSSALVILKLEFASFAAAGLIVAVETLDREQAVAEAARGRQTVALLQEALLPARQLRGANFEANGVYLAASTRLEVGGDWYDVTRQGDGSIFVSVGDVVGHGPEAVAVMGRLRFMMAAFAGLGGSPAEVLEQMDAHSSDLEGALATTIWAGSYDPALRRLTYSAAGHPPPLLRRDGHDWEWLAGGRSVPLGVDRNEPRPNAVVELAEPSTLVVYTDGAVERPGEVIDVGLARLRRALTELRPTDAELLLRSVAPADRADDTVVLWIDLRPEPGDRSAVAGR
jgi:integral membrane sensor domain MASE1